MRTKLLIAIGLLACAACKQRPAYVWNYEPGHTELLNGAVKQITFGDSTSVGYYAISFDEKGIMKSSLTRDTSDDDTLDLTLKNEYAAGIDEDGHLTKLSCKTIAEGDGLNSNWKFDAASRPIQIEKGKGDTDRTIIAYKYGSRGNIIEQKLIAPEHQLKPKITRYHYDENHHLIERDEYVANGPKEKVAVKYLAFDQHYNWVKKVEIHDELSALKTRRQIDTISRSITYY